MAFFQHVFGGNVYFLSTSSPRFILLEITNLKKKLNLCLFSVNSSRLLVFLIALQLTHLDRKKFVFLVFFFQFSEAVWELCDFTVFFFRI